MTVSPPGPAVDLSHHLNTLSRARHPSPLKNILKYMGQDGMISFAGGLPHPSLFPFRSLNFSAYSSDALDASKSDLEPGAGELPLEKYSVVSTGTPDSISLAQALQYSGGDGQKPLAKWSREFVQAVYKPAYHDFEVLLNNGNTDAWCKVVRVLCEPGEYILCEEYTYPSAQAAWVPMGCRGVPVKMDGYGLQADDLERVLGTWGETHPGVKQPHVLYIVPSGSNPASSTMPAQRRREIYDICVKYDVIICEDEPYYFLQYAPYGQNTSQTNAFDPAEFVSSLEPSFLQFDRQGRVIRLESFSKTLAPGNRVGFFVTNPIFTERLLRATEVETQAPSGWSQVIVFELLHRWGIDGYLKWLADLGSQYRARRDWMCDAFCSSFNTTIAEGQLVAHLKSDSASEAPVFSFTIPAAGMFIWVKFYFESSPIFKTYKADTSCKDPEEAFSAYVWQCLIQEGVLLTPGSYYFPWQGHEKTSTTAAEREQGVGYFRFAFSTSTKDEIYTGMERIGKVVEKVWAPVA